jgi:hypothetical protein
MKQYMVLSLALLAAGCVAMVNTPWDWLDDPSQQAWKEVVINGFGREIRFSVPDRLKKGGQHLISWPRWEKGQDAMFINLDYESLTEPFLRPLAISWDWYWGGFYKDEITDFNLSVEIKYFEKEQNLLDLTLNERVERQWQGYKNFYKDSPVFKEFFFEYYWVKTYVNQHSIEFIVENQPQTLADNRDYLVPISDHHQLEFSFFVRDKRWAKMEDTSWNKSRWDIVDKIMETVQITPSPHN